MINLEEEQKRLAEYKAQKSAFLQEIKEAYLDDDDLYKSENELENGIYYDETIMLEWYEKRDLEYVNNIVGCQETLVSLLKVYNQNNKIIPHKEKKELEILLHEARQIRQRRLNDIQQAQSVVDAMDNIIKACDEIRK